jgi:hypothetical protein
MLSFRGLALALAVLGAACLGFGSTTGAEASYHGHHRHHAKKMYHAKPAHHHHYVKVVHHAKPRHHHVAYHHPKPKHHHVAYHHPKPKHHHVAYHHPKPKHHHVAYHHPKPKHHHVMAHHPKPSYHHHKHAQAGKCGTYKYYKNGHCMDARLKA